MKVKVQPDWHPNYLIILVVLLLLMAQRWQVIVGLSLQYGNVLHWYTHLYAGLIIFWISYLRLIELSDCRSQLIYECWEDTGVTPMVAAESQTVVPYRLRAEITHIAWGGGVTCRGLVWSKIADKDKTTSHFLTLRNYRISSFHARLLTFAFFRSLCWKKPDWERDDCQNDKLIIDKFLSDWSHSLKSPVLTRLVTQAYLEKLLADSEHYENFLLTLFVEVCIKPKSLERRPKDDDLINLQSIEF